MKVLKSLVSALLLTLLLFVVFTDAFVTTASRNYLHAPALTMDITSPEGVRLQTIEPINEQIEGQAVRYGFDLGRFTTHYKAHIAPKEAGELQVQLYPSQFVYGSVLYEPLAVVKEVKVNDKLVKLELNIHKRQPLVLNIAQTAGITLEFDASRAFFFSNVLWVKLGAFFAMSFLVFGFVFGMCKETCLAKFEFDINWQHFGKNFLLFLTIFFWLFWLNIHFFPVSDDLAQYLHSQTNAAFFDGVNSRLGELLWRNVFAKFVLSPVYDAANAFMGACFFFVFFAAIFSHLPANKCDLFTFCVLLGAICYYGVFGSTFLWGAGSFNYLLPATLFFGFFWLIRHYYIERHGKLTRAVAYALMLLVGFLAAVSHEWLAALMCASLVCLIVWLVVTKRRVVGLGFATAAVFAGFWLLFVSKGQQEKIALYRSVYGEDAYYSLSELLQMSFGELVAQVVKTYNFLAQNDTLYCFLAVLALYWASRMLLYKAFGWRHLSFLAVLAVGFAADKVGLAMIVLSLLMLLDAAFVQGVEKTKMPLILFAAWLFIGFCLVVLDGTPLRARFLDTTMLIASVGVMWRQMARDFAASQLHYAAKFEFGLKLWAIAACMVGVFYASSNGYANGVLQLRQNEAIRAQIRQGKTDIVLPPVLAFAQDLGRFCDWAILGSDPTAFPNDAYARFYRVNSIRVAD